MDIQGVIRALDAAKGDLLWQVTIGGPAYSSPTLAGDVVYALTEEGGLLYAFDALTGDELWREVTGREGDFRAASPVPYDNLLFVSSNSMGLVVYRRLGSG
jgi:outer membrane protein assembly factor BamB